MGFLLDLLFPLRCISCGAVTQRNPLLSHPNPFCETCAAKWEHEKYRCRSICHGQPIATYYIGGTKSGQRAWALYAVSYEPKRRYTVNSKFILRLKNQRDDAAARFAADELFGILETAFPDIAEGAFGQTVVAWIPRGRESMMRYGFDHMKYVAKFLSKRISASWTDCICRSGYTSQQKLMSYAERTENAEKSLFLKRNADVSGKTVILIDDIITTGASLGAATDLLLKAGVSRVVALTLAMTFHDDSGE